MMWMAFAETFKALSDPVRREILVLLKKEKLSAGEIGKHFEMILLVRNIDSLQDNLPLGCFFQQIHRAKQGRFPAP